MTTLEATIAPATAEKRYSVEEWLELERQSDVRHEFYYGTLIAMAGESKRANLIAGNIKRHLEIPIYEKGFFVFDHDVKAEVSANEIYRYPDLVVAPVADDADDFIVKLPIMLVEVASELSSNRDRVKKRKEYRKIPSLWYYLGADQDEMLVELHARNENGQWETQFFTEASETIEFEKFGLSILLSEIYWRTNVPV